LRPSFEVAQKLAVLSLKPALNFVELLEPSLVCLPVAQLAARSLSQTQMWEEQAGEVYAPHMTRVAL